MVETKKESIGRIYRKSLVKAIKDGVENSNSTFLVSYTAVSSAQMDALRKELRQIGADVYVSKNRIAKLALKELQQEKLADEVKGQTAFIWSNEDSALITKALVEFAKKNEGVLVKAGLLAGDMLAQADVKRLSELPSKDALRAQLLQIMLAPMTRFAGILNSKSRDLLSILKQLSEKNEGGK